MQYSYFFRMSDTKLWRFFGTWFFRCRSFIQQSNVVQHSSVWTWQRTAARLKKLINHPTTESDRIGTETAVKSVDKLVRNSLRSPFVQGCPVCSKRLRSVSGFGCHVIKQHLNFSQIGFIDLTIFVLTMVKWLMEIGGRFNSTLSNPDGMTKDMVYGVFTICSREPKVLFW